MALAVIEHTALFALIDRRFKGEQKLIAFAAAGAAYEFMIAQLKAQDADSDRKM